MFIKKIKQKSRFLKKIIIQREKDWLQTSILQQFVYIVQLIELDFIDVEKDKKKWYVFYYFKLK